MREQFPSCFCFCCGTPEAAFVGASPELLVRRSGASVSTVALAGSTRRSSDPAVDDHLGEQLLRSDKNRREQRIVAERIVRALRPHAVWVEAARRAGDRQGRQHPAPGDPGDRPARRAALGDRAGRPAAPDPRGRRRARASAAPPRSPSSSGWTAAGTPARSAGWTPPKTASSASACAARLLRDREAHLFAGVGVVAGSDPAAELAETEIKLQALLPLLTETARALSPARSCWPSVAGFAGARRRAGRPGLALDRIRRQARSTAVDASARAASADRRSQEWQEDVPAPSS